MSFFNWQQILFLATNDGNTLRKCSYIWKNSRRSLTNLHIFSPPPLIFEQIGIRQWKFFWELTSMWTQFWSRRNPRTRPHMADMWPEISATSEFRQKWVENLPQFFSIGECTVTGGCTCCLPFLGMKGTYISFQSMVVPILDHVFKYRSMGLVSGAPENGLFSAIFAILGQKGDFAYFWGNFKPKYLFEHFPYENDQGMKSF